MTGSRQPATEGFAPATDRPRYQYWLLPFVIGAAIALIVALWLFPRGDVLAAPSRADALEAQYLVLQGDAELLRAEIARLAALFAAERRQCLPPERPRLAVRRPPAEEAAPPQPEPKADEALRIPEEAKRSGDMSFLQGCWYTVTDLFDLETKKPIVIEYCFSGDGIGRTTIIEQGGQPCSAPARAHFDASGKLMLEDMQNLRCTGGGFYYRSRVECTSSGGGQATCSGIPERGKPWIATIKRKGSDVDLETGRSARERVRPRR